MQAGTAARVDVTRAAKSETKTKENYGTRQAHHRPRKRTIRHLG